MDKLRRKVDRLVVVAAVLAVAATYFYWLVVVRSALPQILAAQVRDEGLRQVAMAALALGGLVGCAGAARLFSLERYQGTLAHAFRGCGFAGVLALLTTTWWVALFAAIAAGVALGWLSVALVGGLRAAVGVKRLGFCVGLGVALGHGLAALPAIGLAGPRTQIVLATVLAVLGVFAGSWLRPELEDGAESESVDSSRSGLWWGLGLLALGALAAAGHERMVANELLTRIGTDALVEFGLLSGGFLLLALAAGVLLDGGKGKVCLAVAAGVFLALTLGCLVGGGKLAALASSLYVLGMAPFAVILFYLPARSGQVWWAAQVMALALWIGPILGSALMGLFG